MMRHHHYLKAGMVGETVINYYTKVEILPSSYLAIRYAPQTSHHDHNYRDYNDQDAKVTLVAARCVGSRPVGGGWEVCGSLRGQLAMGVTCPNKVCEY